MLRNPQSHKGDNGKVLIVGGNEIYHGAPLLVALGAEKSGVDLVYVIVPSNQQHLARSISVNFIVGSLKGKYLRTVDIEHVVDWSRKVDVMIIGNGLGEKAQTQRAIRKILQRSRCKLVIDAAALPAFAQLAPLQVDREIVITPHKGEFSRFLNEKEARASTGDYQKEALDLAQKWKASLVLKGQEDLLVGPKGAVHVNKTGNAIMTKGGTGDVLAGLIGGLMAQGLSGFEASKKACEEWGVVGEYIAKKIGTMSTLEEMIKEFRDLKM